MNFIDTASVTIVAGNGGDGRVSFRHEKFVDKGGPDGGDGGHGGDVVFIGSNSQNTLASFRYQKELKAKDGRPGGKTRKHGRNGLPLRVKVPVGTQVLATDGTLLADLTADGQEVVVAKGGRGGFGNAHFISSTRQAPKFAEKGEIAEPISAKLELKMIADVGLVGLPNAGKSTFLGRLSNARPEIADYPFTTLRPNLGVVDVDGSMSILVADIPGLIAGASQGKGLGDEFLRHVERTKVLIHLIDAYNDDLAEAYKTIQEELRSYKIDLSDRLQVVALNKTEGLDQEMIDDFVAQLRTVVPAEVPIFPISAQAGQGLQPLLYGVKTALQAYVEQHVEEVVSDMPVISLTDTEKAWRVSRQGEAWLVTGNKIEKFAARTDFDNEEGIRRLRDIMRKMGIMHELVRKGIEAEQVIRIGARGEFTY